MKCKTHQIATQIRHFADHSVTRLVLGIVLLATALFEIEEGLLIELREGGVGSHHGIAAFGVMTMVAALPDLLEGLVAGAECLSEHANQQNN